MDQEIIEEDDLDLDIPNSPDKLDISLYADIDNEEIPNDQGISNG
jgi:hypothetical protein